jgi:hypothetical protein
MLYRKNVGSKESAIRIASGIIMIVCGVFGLHATPLGFLVMGIGIVTLATGLFGYCPACAVAGRKSPGLE